MILKRYTTLINFLARRPAILLALAAMVLLCCYPIKNIHQDTTGEGWLPNNPRQLSYKNRFIREYGSDELMMLYLTFPNTYNADQRLTVVKKVNDTILHSIKGFESVFSRYNVEDINELMGSGYARKINNLYFKSKDSTGEMLYLKVRAYPNIVEIRPALLDTLHRNLIAILPNNVSIHLAGQSIVFTELNRLSSSDSTRLFGICFGLIILLLWWQVKRFSYLLLSLALVILALLPAISLFGLLNIPFNMITMMAPLLFVVNFSSFAIHIITKQSSNVFVYLKKKAPPIISSAAATIIGFGSLYTSDIKLISQFGLLTSLGILYGLIVLLIIGVPLTIRLIKINELVINTNSLNHLLDRFYESLNKRGSYYLLGVLIGIMAVAVIIFPKIKADTNAVELMKADNSVRQTVEYIEQHFGAGNSIDFLIVKQDSSAINNEDVKQIASARKSLSQLKFINTAVAYDSWKPFFDRLATSDSTTAAHLRSNFITIDQKSTRLMINIPTGSVKVLKAYLDTITLTINKQLQADQSKLALIPVGFLPTYIDQMNTIVDGMLNGLVIAIVLILLVMFILVRDFKLGVITLLVTVFPLCGVALLMKFLNIPFDVGTSIISSVAIGMIADDALHIIWNFRQQQGDSSQPHARPMPIQFADAIRGIVYPCAVTRVMFSIGFMVLLFSNMISIIEFGLLSTATIVIAWFSDFFFFPALLTLFYKKKN